LSRHGSLFNQDKVTGVSSPQSRKPPPHLEMERRMAILVAAAPREAPLPGNNGSMTELDKRLDFGLAAARAAQDLILSHYQTDTLTIEAKSDASPVTVADRGAELLIRERLAEAFPQDGVFGEEYGESRGTNGYRWILDPIDGTKAFVAGVPLFGTMIGLERDGECVVGIVRFPALDEVAFARRGGGTWWQRGKAQPRRTQVTPTRELSASLLCFTDVDGWVKVGRVDAFQRLCGAVRIARGWGDCYGHTLVALGRADAMVDPLLNPWDAAAIVPLVTEAGGSFVDWTGASSIHGGNGVSSNGRLTAELLEILRPDRDC
jgi:histidinol phosphatase-like enzyme (inositol monophosphatase family)